MRRNSQLFILIIGILYATISIAIPQWQVLPPMPKLPSSKQSGNAPVNGIKIWYAVFGHGEPVILLHGGLANSNYWAHQIKVLEKHYQVIVMDSRGHGRSTRDNKPYSYELMESDVIGLMDFLKIKRAAVVGWSDGAIIGLVMAIHHPERVTKLFAFAANSDPSGTLDPAKSVVFSQYSDRAGKEYAELSPTPNEYKKFFAEINQMWQTEPHITALQLKSITTPTWIVDGDHDEVIKRSDTEFMASQIPNAGLLIQPQVSHFSFLQDPEQFNDDLLHFLQHEKVSH